MLVALDANIWISQRMLRSSLGAALLYALHQAEGRILLTDTVEKEIVIGTVREGEQSVDQIKKSFVTIQTLVGTRPEYALPSAFDFEQHIYQRLKELERLLYKVDCNINHYQSAIDRVISKQAPNATREQYRDTLLWEVVAECAEKEEVHFITNDSDFFQDKNFSKGLAYELKTELQKNNTVISIYQKLDEFLSKINKTIASPNYVELSALLNEAIIFQIKEQVDNKEWDLGELKRYEIEAFLTEEQENLALSFTLTYPVFKITQPDETSIAEGELIVKGDSIYSLTKKAVSEIRLGSMNYYDLSGERISSGVVCVSGELVLGVRTIPYRLRRKL